ncbi:MAG TPA: cytochrome c peroxidase [Burkholderiales bacterium]|nr:cytochrome c peroxidase [Burkholderiales bacterium]
MSRNTPGTTRTKHRIVGAAALAACTLLAATARADEGSAVKFAPKEIETILSHGPWPMPAVKDVTNRVSGKREAIELGTRLFFEQRMSTAGQVSCGTCHVPERNWTDNLPRGIGMVEVYRNTPTLWNLRAGRFFGWDGASDSLWAQSLRPIVDVRELASSPQHVARLVRDDEQLACRYRKAFGAPPSQSDDEAVFVNIGKALAAFLETLTSGRTPFDNFRDALARGRTPPPGTYSEPAQRGLKIFIGKGGCTNCHSGPNFTSGEFFSTGLSKFQPLGKPDPGRLEGIRTLLESRYNLMGKYNDDVTRVSATRTRAVKQDPSTFGEFKVPSLRNLALSHPYARDGQVDSLTDVVRHYSEIDPIKLFARDGSPAKPLELTAREQSDLVVFLESLSTFTNPWRPDDHGDCL